MDEGVSRLALIRRDELVLDRPIKYTSTMDRLS
jgi:hypothetical protein